MKALRSNLPWNPPRHVGKRWVAVPPRQLALALPLAKLPAPLKHGALGVWDEVAVGVVLVACAIAYAVWFILSGRKEGPPDT